MNAAQSDATGVPASDVSPRQLTRLVVGDAPSAWAGAGFNVVDGIVQVGSVGIELAGADRAPRGVIAWGFEPPSAGPDATAGEADLPDTIDGVLTLASPRRAAQSSPHPNGVDGFDHLVMRSPNRRRTVETLEHLGFEARRTRTYEMGGRAMAQTFFWLGDVILELVTEADVEEPGPATLWGFAFTSSDIDATVEHLGDLSSDARDAVQPGRRIASLRHKAIDVTVPVAFMTPHVRRPTT